MTGDLNITEEVIIQGFFFPDCYRRLRPSATASFMSLRGLAATFRNVTVSHGLVWGEPEGVIYAEVAYHH